MEESPSFEIILHPVGEGSYRVKNYEDQRPNIVDRMTGKSLMVKASLDGGVHGTMKAPDGDLATLIFMEFQFSHTKSTRRFQSAEIIMTFSGARSERDSAEGSMIGSDPEVKDIQPRYRSCFLPTKTKVDVKHSAHLSGQGGAYGANMDTGWAWERNQSFETEHEIVVNGGMSQEGRSDGADNTVRWALMENGKEKKGIPSVLRTAVLLKRETPSHGHSGRFQATVKIEACVDLVSFAQTMTDKVFGKIPLDEPVLFDPRLPGKVPR